MLKALEAIVRVGCLVALGTVVASAQTAGGLADVVRDTIGSVLPGVTVTVVGAALVAPRTVITDEHGGYVLDALPAGRHLVTATFSGFEPWSTEVEVGASGATLDVVLGVSSFSAGSAGNEKLLVRTNVPKSPTGWSSDGGLLVYTATDPQTGGDLWAVPLVGTPEPFPLLRTAADERYGTLSPDGHWLAYVSNETATYEVYVEAFPSRGSKRQVSTHGGFEPSWRRDGRELFYMAPNQTLMSVEVMRTLATVEFSAPTPLFPTRFKWMEIQAVARHYAAARDGQRFLISSATGEAQSAPVTVVLN